MIECKASLKPWGNSFGVVIPKESMAKEGLRPNQMVRVIVSPMEKLKVKDIFGKLSFKRSTARLLKEIDDYLDSRFLKQ